MVKTRLLYQFLLLILPLLIISIVMTGIILSWTSYSYFRKTVDQDYRNIIKASGGEIRFFMEHAKKDLEALALVTGAIKPDLWQKEMALTAFNHAIDQFMSVSLLSTDGKEILSTGREGKEVAFMEDETFRKVLKGQIAISGVMLTKENIPYVHVASPVFHLGAVEGIIWAELNLKAVWDVLEGIHVGRTGQVSIMDHSGRFIGHREIDRVIKSLPAEGSEILKRLRASDTPVPWVEKREGIRLYCMGYLIPGLDWIIVLNQAYGEIYAYLYRNISWAASITFFICLAAILLGWNWVKDLLTPIHSLHAQVHRIGQGDLDQKVSIGSRDEISELGQAFNEMTDSLKGFIRREVETAKELTHAKNLAVLGTTSSKVTHEVGNLLNNVGLTISTLKGERLSPAGEKALEIMEKDAVRVRGFIQNFLQFAKKPELHLEKTPLGNVIKEVLMTYSPEAERRGIHLELNWPSDLPEMQMDTRLIYQVFSNLVKNGLEAMTGPGKLSIAGSIQDGQLVVRIEDPGPGIRPDILGQIFDPFFTTKGKKGTGLGLSIVKTIMEAHRGSIECMSEPEKGTAFVLRLPLR